jgi:hypothetical protein
MGFLEIFKRNKQPVDSDATRRSFLSQKGRITEGTIIDEDTTDAGDEVVRYIYSVQGVDFESSDILSDEQKKNFLQYAPGAKVSVRFDPKNHGNSMLV